MSAVPTIVVLGGGVAGLAAGFYATRRGMSATVFEAGDTAGGNARTLAWGGFRFDTGAHRFHDRDPGVTADVQALLGPDLVEVDAPSQICWRGQFLDFPLRPASLLRALGLPLAAQAAGEVIAGRLRGLPESPSFADVALRAYGRTIADRFLLGYSEKLWGIPCAQLSPAVAGRRLQGLSLRQLLREVIWKDARTAHLEGRFYYPVHGIGQIADSLVAHMPAGSVRLGRRITRLVHDGHRITSMEVNGADRIDVRHSVVLSTLAPSLLAELLSPAAPAEVLTAARALRFRHVVLVTLFIDRPGVTPNATIYFPEPAYPFTRASEPRNRSRALSPSGRTSLSLEIPCWTADAVWTATEGALIDTCSAQLAASGLLRSSEIAGGAIHRIPRAYPALHRDVERHLAVVHRHTRAFRNLRLAGRNGLFSYVHLHDLLLTGRELVDELAGAPARP